MAYESPDKSLNREKVVSYLRLMLINGVVFAVCYLGPNLYAAVAAKHYRLYFSWEANIPFYPSWIYVYLSILLWFFVPLFVLPRSVFEKLSRTFLVTTLLAGVIFILLPAQSPFDRSLQEASSHPMFALVYFLDKPYNLFPSLHIAYVALFVYVFRYEKVKLTYLWYCWGLLLVVSVLFTHQHQIMDIVGGFVLAGLAYWLVYSKRARVIV